MYWYTSLVRYQKRNAGEDCQTSRLFTLGNCCVHLKTYRRFEELADIFKISGGKSTLGYRRKLTLRLAVDALYRC